MRGQTVSDATSAPDFGPSEVHDIVDRLARAVGSQLASVKSSAQLLQRLAAPSAELGLYHDSILTAVDRLEEVFLGLGSSLRAGAGHTPETGASEDSGAAASPGPDLAAVVRFLAHEVRNPLAIIKSGVQLLQRLSPPTPETAAIDSTILAQVGRIDATVAGLERFAFVSAGHPGAVAVAAAVDRVVALRRAAGERAGVTLRARGDGALRVRVDRRNLELALGELLANAIRFSPPDSAVTVSWSAGADKIARIDIDDLGPGVTAEHALSIVRPLFSTSAEGTSLGLSFVDRVCRLAGGALQWSNLTGGGCRFSVSLPLV